MKRSTPPSSAISTAKKSKPLDVIDLTKLPDVTVTVEAQAAALNAVMAAQCPSCKGLSHEVHNFFCELRDPIVVRERKIGKYIRNLVLVASFGLDSPVKYSCQCEVHYEPGLAPNDLLALAILSNFLVDNRSSMAKAQDKAGDAWLKDEEGEDLLSRKERVHRNQVFMLGEDALLFLLPEDCF